MSGVEQICPIACLHRQNKSSILNMGNIMNVLQQSPFSKNRRKNTVPQGRGAEKRRRQRPSMLCDE